FTVTAKDTYGNTATGYTGTVAITSSDGAAVLPSNHTFTTGGGGNNGVYTGFSVTLKTAGTQSITATDTGTSSITGSQTGITVNDAGLDLFALTPSTSTPTAGTSFTVAITAQDAFNNTVGSYTGTHCIDFSGPGSSPNSTTPTYPVQGVCAS